MKNNTALSTDMVNPCSAGTPVSLSGSLSAVDQDRTVPVAKITVTRVSGDTNQFLASLSGAGEVQPPVLASNAWGQADFTLNDNMTELSYRLKALKMESGAIQAAIHQGLPDDNGPVVAYLYKRANPVVDERLNISGRVKQNDLVGPLAGDCEGFVDALHAGELYVNSHSNAYPGGEIRGQVGTK